MSKEGKEVRFDRFYDYLGYVQGEFPPVKETLTWLEVVGIESNDETGNPTKVQVIKVRSSLGYLYFPWDDDISNFSKEIFMCPCCKEVGVSKGMTDEHAADCVNIVDSIKNSWLASDERDKEKLDAILDFCAYHNSRDDTPFETKAWVIRTRKQLAQKARNSRPAIRDTFMKSSGCVNSPSEFPENPGIYAIFNTSSESRIPIYIGKSDVGLRERWKNHHRSPEVNLLLATGSTLEFRYVTADSLGLLGQLGRNLTEVEASLIEAFNPRLNNKIRTIIKEEVNA